MASLLLVGLTACGGNGTSSTAPSADDSEREAKVRAETGTNPPQLQPEELPEERKMRLTVRDNDTGKTVLSIPLVDCALLVKGEYRRDMDEQEFLDRMDEYNIVCVLGEGMRWVSMSINIHSWKMVWQNTGI